LQEGRKSASVHASSEVIWGIPTGNSALRWGFSRPGSRLWKYGLREAARGFREE
jgi:hypothetical protein